MFKEQDTNAFANQQAARLLEILEQAAGNDPDLGNPTLEVDSVKEIGQFNIKTPMVHQSG